MPTTGYIQIYAYTSNARIPLRDVAVMISDTNNQAISMGLTDRSGKFGPVPFAVPNREESLTPTSGPRPFLQVNVHARKENFEQIEANDVQVFANTITIQNFEMIPLSEFPDEWSKTEFFNTPPQNL